MAILTYSNLQNRVSEVILQSAFKVHKNLGPGLLESAYSYCLYHELRKTGLKVERGLEMSLSYQGTATELKYQIDLIVEGRIVLLTKSVAALSDVHTAELHTHLVVADCPLGFLFNFNVTNLKHGVRRIKKSSDRTRTLAVS